MLFFFLYNLGSFIRFIMSITLSCPMSSCRPSFRCSLLISQYTSTKAREMIQITTIIVYINIFSGLNPQLHSLALLSKWTFSSLSVSGMTVFTFLHSVHVSYKWVCDLSRCTPRQREFIQNPSSMTNPTMEPYFFFFHLFCRAVPRDKSQTHWCVSLVRHFDKLSNIKNW